jgi:hypothetical protein
MKKIFIALALCLVMVGLIATPAFAATQKVDLVKYPGPGNPPAKAGYATFTTDQGDRALVVGITVTNATARTKYGVYLQGDCGLNYTLGYLTTNSKGKWGGQNEQYQFEKVLPVGNYTRAVLVLKPIVSGNVSTDESTWIISNPPVAFNITKN